MKRILIILSLALCCLGLNAAVTAVFNPGALHLNHLSTFTFDPVSPGEQPILTQLTITNQGPSQKLKLQTVLRWNSQVLIQPAQAVFITKEPLATGHSIMLTNRHLISESSSSELETEGNLQIDIIRVMKNCPTLKNAILSGYFPDGEIQLEVSVKAEDSPTWEDTKIFTIRIRNAGAIYPISPGKAMGQEPSIVENIPVSFLWNALNTGFNEQQIVIKEFPPNSPPSFSTVAQTGVDVYRTPEGTHDASGFSDYIPFSDKYYYAWRVYTPIYDQTNLHELDKTPSQSNFLASEWFVFRYLADDVNAPDPNDVWAMLMRLGDLDVINILNTGHVPTGEVIFEGRRYTGKDAMDILDSLMGRDFSAELKD